MSDVETRVTELGELKSGVQLRAGHKIVLVVNGAQGSTLLKDLGAGGWDEEEEAAKPASAPASAADDKSEGGGAREEGAQAAADGPAAKGGAQTHAEAKGGTAGAGEDKPEAPKEEPAKEGAKQDQPGAVKNPRWGKSSPAAGDEVEMLADVTGGGAVRFSVERRAGAGQWEKVAGVDATVSGGTARATTRLEHTGALEAVRFRFSAKLVT